MVPGLACEADPLAELLGENVFTDGLGLIPALLEASAASESSAARRAACSRLKQVRVGSPLTIQIRTKPCNRQGSGTSRPLFSTTIVPPLSDDITISCNRHIVDITLHAGSVINECVSSHAARLCRPEHQRYQAHDCRCSCVPRDYRRYRVQVIPKAALAVDLRKQKSPAQCPGFWVSPLHTQE